MGSSLFTCGLTSGSLAGIGGGTGGTETTDSALDLWRLLRLGNPSLSSLWLSLLSPLTGTHYIIFWPNWSRFRTEFLINFPLYQHDQFIQTKPSKTSNWQTNEYDRKCEQAETKLLEKFDQFFPPCTTFSMFAWFCSRMVRQVSTDGLDPRLSLLSTSPSESEWK